mgnify:CR=1 FL=1
MVENLDDTLSVHPLFHKPGNICDGNLLFQEIFSTVSSDRLCDKDEQEDHNNSQNRQNRAQRHHGNKRNHDGNGRHQHLRDGLVNHLTQGIRIIGVKTHDGAVGILVKIADRKFLHMFKHIISDLF